MHYAPLFLQLAPFYQPQAVSNFGVACCCSSASSSSSEDRCLQNCVILVFMGTMPMFLTKSLFQKKLEKKFIFLI